MNAFKQIAHGLWHQSSSRGKDYCFDHPDREVHLIWGTLWCAGDEKQSSHAVNRFAPKEGKCPICFQQK